MKACMVGTGGNMGGLSSRRVRLARLVRLVRLVRIVRLVRLVFLRSCDSSAQVERDGLIFQALLDKHMRV